MLAIIRTLAPSIALWFLRAIWTSLFLGSVTLLVNVARREKAPGKGK